MQLKQQMFAYTLTSGLHSLNTHWLRAVSGDLSLGLRIYEWI